MLNDLLERYRFMPDYADDGREQLRKTIADYLADQPPAILFDGFAVLQALDEKAKDRTSPENVSDVLDAVVRIMRSNLEVRGCGDGN